MNIILPTPFGSQLKSLFVTLLLTALCTVAYPQDKAIPNLKLIDVNSKKEVVMSDYKGKTALIVIFFCNTCPYSTYYIDRIRDLKDSYNDFQFVLINSSNPEFAPEESEANMADYLKKNNLNMPYLVDKDKSAMNSFNAKKCPEVFVLRTKDWKTVYNGAIDDNPQVAEDVSDFYLKNALEQIKKGSEVQVAYVRTTGCIIK